jgi:hypothetical protein
MSIELTEQQRKVVQEQTGELVEVIDPDTQRAYVLLAREQYRRMCSLVENEPEASHGVAEVAPGIPSGILRSQHAFGRDLPRMLSQRKLRGRWVCYHGDEQIGIGTYEELIRKCLGRGIPDDAYYLGRIRRHELTRGSPRTSSHSAPPSGR